MRLLTLLAIVTTDLCAVSCAAGEPLPPPKDLPEPPPLVFVNPQWGRINRYAVWQSYGVDHFGYFRPRVIYTPDGAFYYYNGRPFPWLSALPLEFMPYANDD